MGLWQPLLAATPKNDKHWGIIQAHMDREPMWGQPKADGVRCIVRDGLRRRKLDLVLNTHLQSTWGRPEFNGLDGEMAYGTIYNPDVYRISNSNMKLGGSPDMTFYVWDDFTRPELDYQDRYELAQERVERYINMGMQVQMLPNTELRTVAEAKAFAEEEELRGAEGGMGKRRKGSRYKEGRSTIIEGLVVKFKTFEDQEATIIGMEELHSNQNEAVTDARGYNKRSSHQENQIPMNTMGALVLRYDSPEWVKPTGKCGSGFDAATRKWFWDNREAIIAKGTKITFKFQRIGSFERPRFPIFRRIYTGS